MIERLGPPRGAWDEDRKLLFLKLDELIDEINNMKAKLLMPTKTPLNATLKRLKEVEDQEHIEKLERLIKEGKMTLEDSSVYCQRRGIRT